MYVRLFEYSAALGQMAAFETAYGPHGDWARLFAGSDGYLGTSLDRDGDRRYRTQDQWSSQAAFEAFLSRNRDAYDALDRACAPLKSSERHHGDFADPLHDSQRWRPVG